MGSKGADLQRLLEVEQGAVFAAAAEAAALQQKAQQAGATRQVSWG